MSSDRQPGQPRRPGRPSRVAPGADPRERLIRTAATLFGDRGYDSVSLRAVARGAGVTPAMVAYYFTDKRGLLQAVLSWGFEELLETLQAVAKDPDPGPFVPRFITAYLAAINRKPWLPRLLVREVLSKSGPVRDRFVDEVASRAARLIPPRIQDEIAAGRLRSDLDPRFVVLSLIGMCLFPYIAEPVLGPLLGYRVDDRFGRDYSAHVVRLFLDGARGEEA